jgi:hypothetical protein
LSKAHFCFFFPFFFAPQGKKAKKAKMNLEERKERQKFLTGLAQEKKRLDQMFSANKHAEYEKFVKENKPDEKTMEAKFFELFSNDKNELLNFFDHCTWYGPFLDIQRMKRWQRAENLGLEPPKWVYDIMKDNEEYANKVTRF